MGELRVGERGGGVIAASEINAETLVVNINMTNMANTKSENSIQHTPHKMPH